MTNLWSVVRLAASLDPQAVVQAGADYLKTLEEERTQREWNPGQPPGLPGCPEGRAGDPAGLLR